MEIARWLVDLGNERDNHINVHVNDDQTFMLSCAYGKIDVVKWLIQTYPGIDIHMDSEYAFRHSCSRRSNLDLLASLGKIVVSI